VLPFQRDRVVEEELRSVLENLWESIPGKIPVEGVRDVGEHEGSVSGQGFGDDGGKGGECIIGADRDARDSTISEEENSSDRPNVILDISGNIPLVEPVLLNAPSVG